MLNRSLSAIQHLKARHIKHIKAMAIGVGKDKAVVTRAKTFRLADKLSAGRFYFLSPFIRFLLTGARNRENYFVHFRGIGHIGFNVVTQYVFQKEADNKIGLAKAKSY